MLGILYIWNSVLHYQIAAICTHLAEQEVICIQQTHPTSSSAAPQIICMTDGTSKKPSVGKREGYAFVTGVGQVITTDKMNEGLVHRFIVSLAVELIQSPFSLPVPCQP